MLLLAISEIEETNPFFKRESKHIEFNFSIKVIGSQFPSLGNWFGQDAVRVEYNWLKETGPLFSSIFLNSYIPDVT